MKSNVISLFDEAKKRRFNNRHADDVYWYNLKLEYDKQASEIPLDGFVKVDGDTQATLTSKVVEEK